MNTSPKSLAPVEQTERIYSLDILRGIVLLGILLMNIVGFGLWGAYQPFRKKVLVTCKIKIFSVDDNMNGGVEKLSQ
jgi:uncharacterized membrane protein YeiB